MYLQSELVGTAACAERGDDNYDRRVDVPKNVVAAGGATANASPRCASFPVEVIDNGNKHNLDRFSGLLKRRSELHMQIQRRLRTWNSDDVAKKADIASAVTPLHAPSTRTPTTTSECPSFIPLRNAVSISLPPSSIRPVINIVPQKVSPPTVFASSTPRIIPQQRPPAVFSATPRIIPRQMPSSTFSSAPLKVPQQLPRPSPFSSASSKIHQQVTPHSAVSSSTPRMFPQQAPPRSALSSFTPLITTQQPHPRTVSSMLRVAPQESPLLSALSSITPRTVSQQSPSHTLSPTVQLSPTELSSSTPQMPPRQLSPPPSLPSMPSPRTAPIVPSFSPRISIPQQSSPARMSARTPSLPPPLVPVHAPRLHTSPRNAIPPRNSPIPCRFAPDTQGNSTHVLPRSSCVAVTMTPTASHQDAVGEVVTVEDVPPTSPTPAKPILSKYKRPLHHECIPGDAHSGDPSSVRHLSPNKGYDVLAMGRSADMSVGTFSDDERSCVDSVDPVSRGGLMRRGSNGLVDLNTELDGAVSDGAVRRRNDVQNAMRLIGGDWRWQRNEDAEEEGEGAAESFGDSSYSFEEYGCRVEQQQHAGHELTADADRGHEWLNSRRSFTSENSTSLHADSPASAARARSLSKRCAFEDSPTLLRPTTRRADGATVYVQDADMLRERQRKACEEVRSSRSSPETEFDELFTSVERSLEVACFPEGRSNSTRKNDARVSEQNNATHEENRWEAFAEVELLMHTTKRLRHETKSNKKQDYSDGSPCERPWCDKQHPTPSSDSGQRVWEFGHEHHPASRSVWRNNSDAVTIPTSHVCSPEQDASLKATAQTNDGVVTAVPTHCARRGHLFQQSGQRALYTDSFTKYSGARGGREARSEAYDDNDEVILPTVTSPRTTKNRTQVLSLTNHNVFAPTRWEAATTDSYPGEFSAIDMTEHIDVRNENAEDEMLLDTSPVTNDRKERLAKDGMVVTENGTAQDSQRARHTDDPTLAGYEETTGWVNVDGILDGEPDGTAFRHLEAPRQIDQGLVRNNDSTDGYGAAEGTRSMHSVSLRKEAAELPTARLVPADTGGNNHAYGECRDKNHPLLSKPLSRFASPDVASSSFDKRPAYDMATEGSDAYAKPSFRSTPRNKIGASEEYLGDDQPDSTVGVHSGNAAKALGVFRAPDPRVRDEFNDNDFAPDRASARADGGEKPGASCLNLSRQNLSDASDNACPARDFGERITTNSVLRAVNETPRGQFCDGIGAPQKYDEMCASVCSALPEHHDVAPRMTSVETRRRGATDANQRRLASSRNDEWDLDREERARASNASNEGDQEFSDRGSPARSRHDERDSNCREHAIVTDAGMGNAACCDPCDHPIADDKIAGPKREFTDPFSVTRPAQEDKGQWLRKEGSNANQQPPEERTDPMARCEDSNAQQNICTRDPVNDGEGMHDGDQQRDKNSKSLNANSAHQVAPEERRSRAYRENNSGDELSSEEVQNTTEKNGKERKHEKYARNVDAEPSSTRQHDGKSAGRAHLNQYAQWSEKYSPIIVENVAVVDETFSREIYHHNAIAEKDQPRHKIPNLPTLVSSASSPYLDVVLSTETLLTHVESTPSVSTSGHESFVLQAPSSCMEGAPPAPPPRRPQHVANVTRQGTRMNTAAPVEQPLFPHRGFPSTASTRTPLYHAYPPSPPDDKSREFMDASPSSLLPSHTEFLMDATDPKYSGIFIDSPHTVDDHLRVSLSPPKTKNAAVRPPTAYMGASSELKGDNLSTVCGASTVSSTCNGRLCYGKKIEGAGRPVRVSAATCIQQWWRHCVWPARLQQLGTFGTKTLRIQRWWREHLGAQRWREVGNRFSPAWAISPEMANGKALHSQQVGNRKRPIIGAPWGAYPTRAREENAYIPDNESSGGRSSNFANSARIVDSVQRHKESGNVSDSRHDDYARVRGQNKNYVDDKDLSDCDPVCESHGRRNDYARPQSRMQSKDDLKQPKNVDETRLSLLRNDHKGPSASSPHLQPMPLRGVYGSNEPSPRYLARNDQTQWDIAHGSPDTSESKPDDPRGHVGVRAYPIGTSAQPQSNHREGCHPPHNIHEGDTPSVNSSHNTNHHTADDVLLPCNPYYVPSCVPHDYMRPTHPSSQPVLKGDVAPRDAERKRRGASPSQSPFPHTDVRRAPTIPIMDFSIADVSVSDALHNVSPWGRARPTTDDSRGLPQRLLTETGAQSSQPLEGSRQPGCNMLPSEGSTDRTRLPRRDDMVSTSRNIADDHDRSDVLHLEDDGAHPRLNPAIQKQWNTTKRTHNPNDVAQMHRCNADDGDDDARLHRRYTYEDGINRQSPLVYDAPRHPPGCSSGSSLSVHDVRVNGAAPAAPLAHCYSLPPSLSNSDVQARCGEHSSPTSLRLACARYDGDGGTRLKELLTAAVRGYITRCNLYDRRAMIQQHFDVCQLILDATDARDPFVENLFKEQRRLRININECVRRPFRRPQWGRRDVVKFQGWAVADFKTTVKKDKSDAVSSGTDDGACSSSVTKSPRAPRPFLRRASTRIIAKATHKAELRKVGTRVECWGNKAQPKRASDMPKGRMGSIQDEPTTRTKSLDRIRPTATRTHQSERVTARAKSNSSSKQVAGPKAARQIKAKSATKGSNTQVASKAASHAKLSVLPELWRFLEKVHGDMVGLEADAFFGPPRSIYSLSKDSALMKQWMSMSDDELVAETRKMKDTYTRLCDTHY
eukprot:GEMP01000189.1.p1 GENE.GEMP01000189.1~~GEMP01000189.1.p1  ORF type:complete len:2706 (+),score=492.69 GEMP01000189.1:386-8503(+)